jgi:hypothetical protein
MSRLALAGEIKDASGMASAVLAAEVGYPGSSIAFAQLLSGMQRSGLIEREVRGKRTYRIAAAPGAAARVAATAQPSPARRAAASGRAADRTAADRTAAAVLAAAVLAAAEAEEAREAGEAGRDLAAATAGPGDFDYDELARRLLVQVVRRLSAAPGEDLRAPGSPELEQTVAGLEQELASVRTMHGTLTAENARLREQLRAARRSLTLAQERPGGLQLSEQLDAAEVDLLERLLAPSGKDRREDAETG